jgi:hypothetical protein
MFHELPFGCLGWNDHFVRLEYLEDLEAQSPRMLLAYGDDPRDATALRRTVEQLAARTSVSTPGNSSMRTSWSDRAFRCAFRPAAWMLVSGLLEPFEKNEGPGARFQWLSEEGPVEWIHSTVRGW